MTRRLYRSVHERVLGGVAGGIAEYFDLDPSLVRIAWAVLVLASAGAFLVLYIVMWIVVPEAPAGYLPGPGSPYPPSASSQQPAAPASAGESGASSPTGEAPTEHATPAAASTGGSSADEWWARRAERRRHRSSGGGALVLGAILILVGAWFLARDWLPWLRSTDIWPVAIILLGIVLLVSAMRPRAE
jgi:phage shock protein C